MRLMASCGCLLMILSMALLFGITVIPVIPAFEDNETIDNFLEPLLCESGETIERDLYSTTDNDGTAYSMRVYCSTDNERRRDVSNRWGGIGVVGFLAPFLIGLAFFLTGVIRGTTKYAAQTAKPFMTGSGITITTNKGGSLADRLKQVEEAQQAGLISLDEYERLREEILKDFS